MTVTLTAREAETIIALLEQEADGLEDESELGPKLRKLRTRYLRGIAQKVKRASQANEILVS